MSARRAALIAALVLGVALALVIAVRTPWTCCPSRPAAARPSTPRAAFTADELDARRVLRRRAAAGVPGLPRPRAGRRRGPRADPARRAAGAGRGGSRWAAGWVWQVLLGVLALAVHRPAGHAAAVGLRRDDPAPLRAVHPRLGAVAPRRRASPRRINAGLTALGLLALVFLARRAPAHVVGLGGGRGRRARRRRVVPVAGGHRAGVQPVRVRCRPGSCAPTCSSSPRRTAPRCRTCWSPTPPGGRRR